MACRRVGCWLWMLEVDVGGCWWSVLEVDVEGGCWLGQSRKVFLGICTYSRTSLYVQFVCRWCIHDVHLQVYHSREAALHPAQPNSRLGSVLTCAACVLLVPPELIYSCAFWLHSMSVGGLCWTSGPSSSRQLSDHVSVSVG